MINTLTDQINSIVEGTVALLPALGVAAVILVITWIVAKFGNSITHKLTGKTDLKPSLRNLAEVSVRLGIWIAGTLLAAMVVFPNFSPAGVIAGLGIGAVAIGFAFQDFFENFLSGVMIMLRDNMQVGDVIKADGIYGKVQFISLRETHIRAFSGELHVVPNSMLFKNPVEVETAEDERRFEVIVGVSYDTDLDEADKVIRAAVEKVDLVNTDKPIQVLADTFNSSSVDFRVRWWASAYRPEAVINRDKVIRSIKRSLDDAGIEIPFPYVTHTFKEKVPLKEAE
ncbi:mechanosensitive ion channel family protein [Qipengyuania sp. S6317L1]|uniref:mechanosensitive ion channel family protein n=1 Tax=Qipengyuania sp. S6317L1 TaxID=2926410 RepID=UPI001FF52367|nr:mechanosensitive ion channel family protein [Qipengyuania sp. S6317L1]MCK0098536.1 mechanosensitive ion channel family protein [Qipengyuania sp. S6317L1]